MTMQTSQTPDTPRRPSRRGLYTVIVVIVLLTVAAVFVRDQFFRIKDVEIHTIRDIPGEAVLEMAGIDGHANYFGIDEKMIEKGINANRYLEYVRMEKVWPDKVVLYVNERRPQANVLYMGLRYEVAGDGMVLERSTSMALDNGCVTVSGLSLRDIRVGSVLVCNHEQQFEAFKAVLAELAAQSFSGEISELNVASLDSIYLVTIDGYTVNLGNESELRAKVGTVRAVIGELRKRGYAGGTIEATVPGEASYRPLN